MVQTLSLNDVIQQFVSGTPNIQGAALVSSDGLPLSSILPASMDEERTAAMSAAMLSLGERIGKELARGNIEIVDSRINGNAVEQTQASFGFRNSRIDFLASSSFNEEIDYFTVIASLPLQLFPNSIPPENNDFKIEFDMQKEGFSLLNVVTDNQLVWMEGEGNVDVDIQGKYNQARNEVTDIQAQGVANFSNSVINGNLLNQEAISNINGQVLFDLAQVNVPNLTGTFSGGQIAISGALPLTEASLDDQSLNVLVDDLSLNIDDLYQADVKGNLAVQGSAIAPKIGGEIELENGEIKIPSQNNGNVANNLSGNEDFSSIKVDNLSFKLGENISIVQPILLSLKPFEDFFLFKKKNNRFFQFSPYRKS